MYRERDEERARRRAASHALGQVVLGSIFAVGGIIGFITTGQPAALGFTAFAILAVLYWRPVWRGFKDDDGPADK